MKKYLLMIGLALCALTVSASYSDSGDIKKAFYTEDESVLDYAQVADFSAELPMALVIEHPHLGSPASNYVMVSEELTGVLKMCIRPPPVEGQKSEYNSDF